MVNKVRVYGKAQNRTALGIAHAYMVMYPQATLEDLRKAFPNELNPDKGVPEIFIYAEEKGTSANWDGYFKAEDELLFTGDRKKVAVVKMWTKPSFERMVSHASNYGIEIAQFEAADKGGKKGGFHLEYLNGYEPPVKKKIDISAAIKDLNWKAFLEILLNVLLWRKGYRIASGILYFILFMMFSFSGSEEDYNQAKLREYQRDYRRLCLEEKWDSAHLIQGDLYDDFTYWIGAWHDGGAFKEGDALRAQEKYHSAAAYIFGKEALHIYNNGGANRNDKLVSLLIGIPSEGTPLSEGVHGNGMFYDSGPASNVPAIDHVVYQTWASFYNDRCDQVLDIAISNNDTELANKIIKLYKTEVITTYQADTIKGSSYCIGTVKYDNTRRENAIKKCNQ